jgi:hypothetical protein
MGLMVRQGPGVVPQNEAESDRAWITPRRAGAGWHAERRIRGRGSLGERGAAAGEV